jgi:hypothetical protein
MPAIDQRSQPKTQSGGGENYEETPAQKKGWENVDDFIATHRPRVLVDDTFRIKGRIKRVLLDEKDGAARYFTKDVKRKNEKTGEMEVKPWAFVKVVATITDPDVVVRGAPLELPVKDIGASFFDGWTTRDGKRSRGITRGGMFNLHLGVTHEEPGEDLVEGIGSWETEDYEDKDVLLVVKYAGRTEDERYKDRRAGLALWLQGFERDPEASHIGRGATRRRDPEPEEEQQEEAPRRAASGGTGRTSERSTTTSRPKESGPEAGPADEETPTRASRSATSAGAGADAPTTAGSTATASGGERKATERQVKFMYAIGHEAGLDNEEIQAHSNELFNVDIEALSTRDASSMISFLQRLRDEA